MLDTHLPLSLCLEDMDALPGDDRYMQCVALVGRRPGLVLTTQGRIGWKVKGPVACELWRSGDGMLALYRPEPGPDLAIELHRAGRSLIVPFGKPVILRHHDLISIEGRTWTVHIHGTTRKVAAPSPLRRNLVATLAAMTVAIAGAGCSDSDDAIDVRDNPPGVSYQPEDGGDADSSDEGDSADSDSSVEEAAAD